MIDDKPIEFLADIGTSRTIINERLVPIAERSHIQASGVELVTANGTLASVVGVKRCKIQLGDKTCLLDVLFSRDLVKDCLLGLDILSTSPYTRSAISKLNDSILECTKKIVLGIATNGSITKSVVINDFTEGRVNCNYIEAGVKVTSPMESTIMEAARTFAYLFEEENVPKESLTLLTEDIKEDLTKLMNAIYAEIQDITANNMFDLVKPNLTPNAPESLTHDIVICRII